MATSDIGIIVKAEDKASKELKKVESSLGKLGSAVGTAGKAIAGFGLAFGAAAFAVGVKGVKDFSEAEKASAMLEHAVIGVTGATAAQLKATSDLADELQRKGVLDGDNIKVGLAQLSTFGLSNKAVQGLGKSLADLAVNQYGVSASGEQLSDTANMIAKALNGQFGVLEKSGIRFNAAQQSAIQFGSEMEKVAAINEGFAQNLKFTNDVALTTTEGSLARASVAMGDLSEKIGSVLSPVVRKLIDEYLIPLAAKLTEIIPNIDGVTDTWGKLQVGFNSVIDEFEKKTGIISQLEGGFSELRSKVQDELAPALEKLWIAGQPLIPFFQKVGEVLAAVVVVALKVLIELLIQAISLIITLITKAAEWAAAFYEFVTPVIDAVTVGLGKLGDAIGFIIKKYDDMKAAALAALAAAKSAVSSIPIVGGLITGSAPGRAVGGPVTAGMPYVVGERGPELFMPGQSGSIIPRLPGAGGGSPMGGVTINIGTFFGGNPEAAAREIGDLVIKRLQMNARVG